MTNKEYRKLINEMTNKIDNNNILKIIFEFVHKWFIRSYK